MAPIHSFLKERVVLAVYITERDGRVIFASRDRQNIGADLSEWIDVRRTLRAATLLNQHPEAINRHPRSTNVR